MPFLFLLVGPPGSGKSTFVRDRMLNDGDHGAACVHINQDAQGKFQHMENFREAIRHQQDIFVDRMNFNRVQRLGYIEQAKAAGYTIKIHVFHVPYAECLRRATERVGHETIKDAATAEKAIRFFFKSYERVEDFEADEVVRHYMEGDKPSAIVCDLDGTLCNIEHRRHFVRAEGKKKNWAAFNAGIKNDKLNEWCNDILESMNEAHKIVLCSGRSENEKVDTLSWLHTVGGVYFDDLFMRMAGDSRKDDVAKEIILDFEILTRYSPYFMIDDRDQVVKMWRKRGFVCLQCDYGDF